jgi:hypothetical protein
MMKTLRVIFASALLTATGAKAGIYTDDLSRCLVAHTDDNDRTVLVRWFFAQATLNPVVQSLGVPSDAAREKANIEAGVLFNRLLLTDCRAQTITALKNEGTSALAEGFDGVGEAAGRGLMHAPEVVAGIATFLKYLDRPGLAALGQEAGLPQPAAPPPPPATQEKPKR